MSDNTGSNLGTGHGVFGQLVGDDLQFKSLIAGTNISLANTAQEITITTSGEANEIVTLGVGTSLYASKSGSNLQFKSLIANAETGISVTSNANDLTFQLVNANIDAGKLGGVLASDFLQKSNNLSGLADTGVARTNLSVYSKAEIDNTVIKNNANALPFADNTYSIGDNSNRWAAIYANRFYGLATSATQVSSLAGRSLAELDDVHTAAPTDGQSLVWDNTNSYWKPSSVSGGGGGPANTDALSEGATNLYFTNTRADARAQLKIDSLVASAPGALDTLNELAASLGDDANFATTMTNALAGKEPTITAGTTSQYWRGDKTWQSFNATNWDTAYGWGDHSGAGYLTSETSHADVLQDGDFASQGIMLRGASAGTYSILTDGSANWNTAFGWGDHASGGYLTSIAADSINDTHIDFGTGANQVSTADVPEQTNLYYTDARFDTRLTAKSTTDLAEGTNLYYTDARVNTRVSALGSANWNTAFGWGDHGTGGYLTSTGVLSSHTDVHNAAPTDGQVLKWVNANSRWEPGTDTGGVLTLTALTDVDAVVAGDDGKILYYDHATTSFKWKADATGGGGPADTDALSEGSTNLYFTNARADVRVNLQTGANLDLSSKSTTNLLEGTNLYYTDARFDTRLTAKSTTNLSEGTNLYYTDARADARITNAGSANWNTAFGWGDHAGSGYLTSETFTSLVQDTTPQLGGNLDVQSSTIKSSGNIQLGEGVSATGITGTLATRVSGLGVYFKNDSDNSKRHYNTVWQTLQTLTTNVDAANKKQGWLVDTKLDLAGYTHGTNDPNNVNSLFGDYTYGSLISSSGNTTANGIVGHFFGAEIRDDSTGTIDVSHIIGLKARAGNFKAGSTATNAYGLYVETSKDGAATITNRYSIYAPQSSDKAYFAGQITTGAITLPNTDGTNGQVIVTDGAGNLSWTAQSGGLTDITSESIGDLADVDLTGIANNKILKYDSGSSKWVMSDDQTGGGTSSFVGHTDTPASYVGTGSYFVKVNSGATAVEFVSHNTANWDTAFGWGDHSGAGYLTSTIDWTADQGATNIHPGNYTDTDTIYTPTQFNTDFDTRLATKSTTNLTEGTNLYYTDVRADARITNAGSANWNTAFGWGDHGTGGYLTSTGVLSSHTDVHTAAATDGQVLKWDNANSRWAPAADTDTDTIYTTFNSDFDTRLATKSTTNLSEGTNLYYTDARADARIGAATFTTLSDVDAAVAGDDGKILYYDHATTSFKWKTDATGGGGGTPGGADTQVQYNNSGSFGGDAGFTYNAGTDTVTAGSFTTTGASPSLSAAGDLDIGTSASNGAISLDPHGSGKVTFKGNATRGAGQFVLNCETNAHGVIIKGPPHSAAASYTLTLPNNDGNNNEVLSTDGSGNLSWVAQSGGGVSDFVSLTDTPANYSGSASDFVKVNSSGNALIFVADPGYITSTGVLSSHTDVHNAAPTNGQVLTWDNANSRWAPAAAGGGGGGTTYEEFKINYATNGSIQTISDTSAGLSSVSIDSAVGGDLTVNFTGYTTPPLSFVMYGYNYSQNKYNFNTMGSTGMTLREVPGGGTAGSPTAFGSFASMTVRCSESETGASRSFGTTTHAWVRFVMGA